MKSPPFAYARAGSLGEVFDLLDRHGDEAKLLAGGQSLLASLNLRLSQPAILIDLADLKDLRGIEERGDRIRIGAMTRHVDVERSALIAREVPLIAAAMPHIAHAAIRNRGTIGGSLAFADPAAELPACAVALQAEMVIAGRNSERRVGAERFYKGLFETDLKPGEVLTAVEFPKNPAGQRPVFAELARRHGDYAMIGLAGSGAVRQGRVAALCLCYFGAGDRPALAHQAARALIGSAGEAGAVDAALGGLKNDLQPNGDLNASPQTRLHLAGVLLKRAIAALIADG